MLFTRCSYMITAAASEALSSWAFSNPLPGSQPAYSFPFLALPMCFLTYHSLTFGIHRTSRRYLIFLRQGHVYHNHNMLISVPRRCRVATNSQQVHPYTFHDPSSSSIPALCPRRSQRYTFSRTVCRSGASTRIHFKDIALTNSESTNTVIF